MTWQQNAYQDLNLTLRDLEGKEGNMSIRFSAFADIDAFLTAIPTVLVDAVQDITDCVVVRWSMTKSGYDDAAPVPPESSELQRKGVFSFETDNGFPVVISVPGIKNSMVVNGTDAINQGDAAITAFINLITGATLLDTAYATSNRGEAIASLRKAVKKHRASSET